MIFRHLGWPAAVVLLSWALLGLAAMPSDFDRRWSEIVALLERGTPGDDTGGLEKARAAGLQALEGALEPRQEVLLRYGVAYASYFTGAMTASADRRRSLLKEAADQLEKVVVLDPTNAEAYALLAAVKGFQVDFPGADAAALGMAAFRASGRADSLEPANPRVAMVQGIGAFYTPVAFGGGLEKAQALLEKAVRLFDAEPSRKPWPNWGRFETHVWLGQVLAKRGDASGARAQYGQALAIRESPWVRGLIPLADKAGYVSTAPYASSRRPSAAAPDASGRPSTQADKLARAESLPYELLNVGLAIRTRDPARIAEFFRDPAAFTAAPVEPTALVPAVDHIRRHGWRRETGAERSRSRREIADAWRRFLGHFSELEDARLDVQRTSFDETFDTADSRVALSLVGRDRRGRREWTRGTADLKATRTPSGGWMLEGMTIGTLESLVAEVDLFTDVTTAAGIDATTVDFTQPPSGSPGARGRASLAQAFGEFGAAAGDIDNDGNIDIVVAGYNQNYVYLNDGKGHFKNVADQVGLKTTPVASAPLLVDIDNDGDLDVFFSSQGQQMVFENLLVPTGKLQFRDISAEAGVSVPTVGFSAVAGDVNGDGLPDIYVCGYNRWDRAIPNSLYAADNGTPNLLFINQGGRRFRERAAEVGVADKRWSYDAELVDYDGDGALDLYVANDFGENALYRNLLKETGQLRFRDVGREVGASRPGFGMGVSFGDYNNDGKLDIHATYMSSTAADRIFRLFPPAPTRSEEILRMVSGNALYENQGNGTYREVTTTAGPFPGGWGWGGGFIDFDNDGWQDIHSVNGMISGTERKDIMPMFIYAMAAMTGQKEGADGPSSGGGSAGEWRPYAQGSAHSFAGYERDVLFLNLRTKRYMDISGVSGLDSITDGRAAVYADFDNDGDLDVFLTTLGGHRLFRNNVGQDAAHLRIALQGTTSGRDAFGAVVRVKSSAGIQTKVKSGGEGHMSQHDPRLLFGLGKDKRAEWIEVTWPSGLKQRFTGVSAGSMSLKEGDPTLRVMTERAAKLGS